MNTPYEFGPEAEERVVYIRPVEVAGLPEELRRQAEGRDTIFAVHNAEGERLALVGDRDLAFVLARQNDLAPVNVH